MPSRRSSLLKKKAAQAINCIDKAIIYLDDLHGVFEPHHPDYAEYLSAIIVNLLQSREWCLDVWARAWGGDPEDYRRWMT